MSERARGTAAAAEQPSEPLRRPGDPGHEQPPREASFVFVTFFTLTEM